MDFSNRHQSRVCGLWLGLPWCCKVLLLFAICQVFLGASAVGASILKVKSHYKGFIRKHP
jgi:hypothetical protein